MVYLQRVFASALMEKTNDFNESSATQESTFGQGQGEQPPNILYLPDFIKTNVLATPKHAFLKYLVQKLCQEARQISQMEAMLSLTALFRHSKRVPQHSSLVMPCQLFQLYQVIVVRRRICPFLRTSFPIVREHQRTCKGLPQFSLHKSFILTLGSRQDSGTGMARVLMESTTCFIFLGSSAGICICQEKADSLLGIESVRLILSFAKEDLLIESQFLESNCQRTSRASLSNFFMIEAFLIFIIVYSSRDFTTLQSQFFSCQQQLITLSRPCSSQELLLQSCQLAREQSSFSSTSYLP